MLGMNEVEWTIPLHVEPHAAGTAVVVRRAWQVLNQHVPHGHYPLGAHVKHHPVEQDPSTGSSAHGMSSCSVSIASRSGMPNRVRKT